MTRSLLIADAVIHDGTSAEPFEGSVRVEGGVVVEVGRVAAPTGEDTEIVRADGRFLMPGMLDAHFHAYATTLDGLAMSATPLSYAALAGAERLRRALARGFTTVRDVAGGDPGIARAIRDGLFASPRYLYTGPALSQTGGHGDMRPGDLGICIHDDLIGRIVDGPEEVRRTVRELFRTGSHAIKLMTSGGVVSPSDPLERPQFSAEEIRVAVDEATRRGSYVAAHSYSPASVRHSVLNGVRSIEHGNLIDADTAYLMAARGAYLDPTLITYDAMNRRGEQVGIPGYAREKNVLVLESGQRALEHARRAGVPIGYGSDLLGELEDEQLNGLRLHVEVDGVANTIESVTRVNAEIVGRDDLGRIGPGAVGDLLLLEDDPFRRPEALWDPAGRTVFQGGRRVG